MRTIIAFLLFFLTVFCKAQSGREELALVEQNRKNFGKVIGEYFDRVNKSEYFIYNGEKYYFRTYVDKNKYDSLVRKNIPDSLAIKKSIFSIEAGNGAEYIYELRAPDGSSNYLYKYKNNHIVEKYSWGKNVSEGYSFEDFINLISFTVKLGPDSSIKSVGYTKYSKLHPEYEHSFSDPIYRMTYTSEGKYSEWFPLKDFTMTDQQVFNYLLRNFPDQSVELMRNVKYSRKYGDTEKKFDNNDAKFELTFLKRKIEEKEKARQGLYDDKDYVTKYRAINGIGVEKRYSADNEPFYYISTAYSNKSWEFYMNPKTGKIQKIQFIFVVDG